MQAGEVSEGAVSDEADLVVSDRELLELAQTHEAALLQTHQLIGAEVAEMHRNGTNQTSCIHQDYIQHSSVWVPCSRV